MAASTSAATIGGGRVVHLIVDIPIVFGSGEPRTSRTNIACHGIPNQVATDDARYFQLRGSLKLSDRELPVELTVPLNAFSDSDRLTVQATPVVLGPQQPPVRSATARRDDEGAWTVEYQH